MCRKTYQHYMHHDVRTPVVLDVDGDEDTLSYAHPWRTTTHTCDVDIGYSLNHLGIHIDAGVDDENDGNTEPGKPGLCIYHSCCVCRIVVERCDEAGAGGDDLPEPEECLWFVLEHRHAQLRFQELIWNQWAQVRDQILGLSMAAMDGQQQQVPGPPEQLQWRELTEVSVGHNWQPVYRRDADPGKCIKWTGWMLDRLAQLYVLREEDARAVADVQEHGLAPGGFARMDRMAAAAEHVRNHEEFVRGELEWAATPAP
ncbi:hypothetical protein PG991_007046 [Apiospora marii]|uniref:Uncharacterized protein n=1 Tax=Apiospora marii TaxID=335849 RepID=A0ABR1S0G8_9PEZI